MYALTKNGLIKKYPYDLAELKRDNANVSFPKTIADSVLQDYGVYRVQNSQRPAYSSATQALVEGLPVFDSASSTWVQQWSVRELNEVEKEMHWQNVKTQITTQAQENLDEFARTRNYSNMLSLCSYANSTNSTFKQEGERGVELRDAMWYKIYQIISQVENNTRPVPNMYQDIADELPPLTWEVL